MNEKIPDRVYCIKDDKPFYDNLRKEGPLKGRTAGDFFMLAVVLGFNEGSRLPLHKGGKQELSWIKDLEEDSKSIIKAIAIAEEDNLRILLDKTAVYSIAEEYANSGIKILKSKILSKDPGSYLKKLETDLREKFKKMKS